ARGGMTEPVPEREERLRRVIVVGARWLEVRGRLERCANLGHTHLDANACAEMYHCRAAGPTHARAPLLGCGRGAAWGRPIDRARRPRCLISARASSPASRAIRRRSRSSTAMSA